MDNRPSTSYECDRSGSVHFTIADSKPTISVQPHVYKQPTIYNYFQPVAREATTSQPSVEIRNCCQTYDIEGETLCEVLKARLQAFYSKLKLPKVAWIDESSELALDLHYVQLQLTNSEEFIEIEEVFQEINNKKPRRILIEGQPGYGKTTLATKLAFDWATNKEYIDFKLVFFIPLRELQQRTIENAIVKIGERCGYRQQQQRINIEHILARHEKEILFVLDGLDELSAEKRSETLEVLYNQMYGDSTVLTSCRTGSFKLTKGEGDELFGQTSNSREFWDKRLSILGIQSIDSKREFLEKFFPEQNVNEIIKRLSWQLELFNSPLYLMMLPIIMENDKDVGHFSTRTNLYKKLFNSIVRHTCVKCGILGTDSEFDLFNSNSSPERIREQMTRFGEQCVVKILKGDLKFEPTDLVMEIYQFGLLTNHKQVTFFTSKTHYEAFHLSIMEFAAAFALSIHLKSNQSALIKDSLESIVNEFRETGGTSLILPFTASLLGNDLDLLLTKIEPFSYWFFLKYALTVQLIEDCTTINISNSKYLDNFIPSYIDLHSFYSELKGNLAASRNLLKYGCDSGKIKQITTDGQIPSELFSDNFTRRLEITVRSDDSEIDRIILFTCASPNLREIFSYPNPFHRSLNECLSLAASPHIESCALVACDNYFGLPLKTIMEKKTFKQIKYLATIIRDEPAKRLVINLLENNQVEHLAFRAIPYWMNMSDLFSAAARSICLTSFSCADINVDLYDITNGGTKHYSFVELNCRTITCRQPISLKNCFNFLRLASPDNIEAITEMEPCEFTCSTEKFNELRKKYPSWVGFNSVKSLKLLMYPSIIAYSEIFGSVWTNLQVLHLKFKNRSPVNHEELIADSIQKSTIVNLIIEIPNNSVSLNLFTHMNRLWANENNSHLKTITFISSAKDQVSPKEVLQLVEGLKRNHWDQVCLDLQYGYLLSLIDLGKHSLKFKVLGDFNYVSPDRPMRAYLGFSGYFEPSDFSPVLSISRTPV